MTIQFDPKGELENLHIFLNHEISFNYFRYIFIFMHMAS